MTSPARVFWGLLLLCLLPGFLQAGGTVTTCDEASLRAALNGGGTVTCACDGTITLANTIVISSDTTIDASGRAVIISGNNAVRIFQINSGIRFAATNLSLIAGRHQGVDSTSTTPPGSGFGGAASGSGGDLNFISCTFSNNTAVGGRGNNTSAFYNGGSASGGAIYTGTGATFLSNCVFYGNSAVGGRGAFVSYYSGGDAFGGAVDAEGSLTAINCAVINNQVVGGSAKYFAPHGDGLGGGFFNRGTATLSNVTFTGNSATGENERHGNGGGICNYGVLTVYGCAFSENTATGGLSTAFNNAGNGNGGGLYNTNQLIVVNCSFSTNQAIGGRSSTFYLAGQGNGGGLFTLTSVAVNGTTFNDCQAVGGSINYGAATPGVAYGGGIWGPASLTNCTVARNLSIGVNGFAASQSGAAASGGGIYLSGGTANFVNSTLANNSALAGTNADQSGTGVANGGGIAVTGATVGLKNTIVSSNSPGGNASASGTLTDNGFNFSSDAPCNFPAQGSMNNSDPNLDALANNGGPTMTMALLSGSPAIDAADPHVFPPTDQRGISRPQGARADIGAFEVGGGATNSGGSHAFVFASTNSLLMLQFPGIYNQYYYLQGTTNFTNWIYLDLQPGDSNGVVTFRSTNFPSMPARFFRTLRF